MRIVRVTAQNVWRLEHIAKPPLAPPWTQEAEAFLLDGRAVAYLRRVGAVMLAVEAAAHQNLRAPVTQPDRCIGAAITFPDPVYQSTMRLGSVCIDHRNRGQGVGKTLFGALLLEALLAEPYAVWLVHAENAAMLALSRRDPLVRAESIANNGYVQFFAERN